VISEIVSKYRCQVHGITRIVVGVVETFGGVFITIGLFTQQVAFLLSGEMAVPYFWSHVQRGSLMPWANGGKLAVLYSLLFLFLAAAGGGSFTVATLIGKPKET
jgi:putative oxidoreductase